MGQKVDVMTVTEISTCGGCKLRPIPWLSALPRHLQYEADDEAHRYRLGQMIAVCLHRVGRDLHIVEHALQFLSELEATLNLEFGKHATLCVV